MTNQNEGRGPADSADDRARRIAEAKARAEAARQARTGGGAAEQPATPAAPPRDSAPAQPPEAATPATAGGEDERARRIAEARARAGAAKAAREGGGPATPAAAQPAAAPQPTAATAPPPAAAAAEGAGGDSADDRAARIAAARARAQAAAAAKAGGEAPPPAAPQRSPEEEAARQARLEEARARAAGAAPAAAPAAAAVAPAPAARPAAPVAATARPMPSGPDDWRAPAGTGTRVVTARPDPMVVAAQQLSRQEVANLVTRRSMMRTSLWATLGMMLIGFILGFVNFFWPRKVSGFGAKFTIAASRLPAPGADPVKIFEAKSWVVNLNPGEGIPPAFSSFGAPSEKGGILALYQKCPHLGCTVPWRSDFDFESIRGWFRCPCHGSTYTKAGLRVFGPAPRPMDTFDVTPGPSGTIVIDTGKITPGGPNNAQRTIQLT